MDEVTTGVRRRKRSAEDWVVDIIAYSLSLIHI